MGIRLLFDENPSARLVHALAADFPASSDVVGALGPRPSDEAIWSYAGAQGLVIVTKDEDFQRFSVWRGFPPKVIWIRHGNASTDAVIALLRSNVAQIDAFVVHPEAAFLPLGRVAGDA